MRNNSPTGAPPLRTRSRRPLSRGASSRSTVTSNYLDDDADDVDDQEFQETLLMIAKRAAASLEGDQSETQESITNKKTKNNKDAMSNNKDNNSNNKDDKHTARIPRNLRQGGDQEFQRPGAYSISPGEGFLRNRSFQKESFIRRKPPPGTDATQVARHQLVQQQLQQSAGSKALKPTTTTTARYTRPNSRNTNVDGQHDASSNNDLDQKPAAKTTSVMGNSQKGTVADDKLLSTSSHHRVLSSGNDDTPQRPIPGGGKVLKRIESIESTDEEEEEEEEEDAASDISPLPTSSPLQQSDRRRRRTRASNRARKQPHLEGFTDEEDEEEANLAPMVSRRTRRSTARNSRTSLRLSMLVNSYRRLSNHGSGFSGSGLSSASGVSSEFSSDKTIAEIAEQSVSNFVKSFSHNLQSMEVLPVAATVVPSEEDLEMTIRSRLETELRTHLSRELTSFRQRLLQEILRGGEFQIAEELPRDDADMGQSEGPTHHHSSGDNDNIHSDFHVPTAKVDPIMRGDNHVLPTDEDSLDPEDTCHDELDDSHLDQLTSLDAAFSASMGNSRRRMPIMPDSFTRSIRQSLRLEFGNIDDGIDLECAGIVGEAKVIDIEAAPSQGCIESHLINLHEPNSALSAHQEMSNDRDEQGPTIGVGPKTTTGKFAFSSRGLMGLVLVVFLLGALVGVGSTMLARGIGTNNG